MLLVQCLHKERLCHYNLMESNKSYLCRAVESSETDSLVVDLELVHAINVWYLEFHLILATADLLERESDEWIDSHELDLHVVGNERLPLAIVVLLNLDGVDSCFGDCVVCRRILLALFVMFHRHNADSSSLTKHPFVDGINNIEIARLLVFGLVVDFLHT
jgi:hypothetical protein